MLQRLCIYVLFNFSLAQSNTALFECSIIALRIRFSSIEKSVILPSGEIPLQEKKTISALTDKGTVLLQTRGRVYCIDK